MNTDLQNKDLNAKMLILQAYFFPDVISSAYLVYNRYERFAEEGYRMELICPSPTRGVDEETRKKYSSIKDEYWHEGRLHIHRFALMKEGKNPISRALRYGLSNAIQLIEGLMVKSDIIFCDSTPPTQGVIAALIAKCKKVPFVYCLQDIFPDSLIMTGMATQNSVLYKLGHVVERFIYRNASKIIVISEACKKNLLEKNVPENKIEVVYNWVDENSVIPVERRNNPLFDEFELSRDAFYVTYAGNLGNAQNIGIILDAANQTKDIDDIQYIIFGGGSLEEEYRRRIKQENLSNVKMFPLQPYDRVSEVYSLGDVSVVSCKKGAGSAALPSKTWSIMSAGTAVLASFDSGNDLQDIINNYQVGVFAEAESTEEMVKGILYLYKYREFCERAGINAREFVLNNLTKEVGTTRYVQIIADSLKG